MPAKEDKGDMLDIYSIVGGISRLAVTRWSTLVIKVCEHTLVANYVAEH